MKFWGLSQLLTFTPLHAQLLMDYSFHPHTVSAADLEMAIHGIQYGTGLENMLNPIEYWFQSWKY